MQNKNSVQLTKLNGEGCICISSYDHVAYMHVYMVSLSSAALIYCCLGMVPPKKQGQQAH